jgi:hypothetical protein
MVRFDSIDSRNLLYGYKTKQHAILIAVFSTGLHDNTRLHS